VARGTVLHLRGDKREKGGFEAARGTGARSRKLNGEEVAPTTFGGEKEKKPLDEANNRDMASNEDHPDERIRGRRRRQEWNQTPKNSNGKKELTRRRQIEAKEREYTDNLRSTDTDTRHVSDTTRTWRHANF
jgi:hypothetical protein